MTTLLIATRNAHKVREIGQIMGGGFRCLTLEDFPGAPVAVEDADTFAGNARKKVLSLAEWFVKSAAPETPFYIMADDSGLEVDAIGGAPGVHSARFAASDTSAGNSPDSANNTKLLHLLAGIPAEKRTARFRCVLAVLRQTVPPSPEGIILFDGVCEGRLSETASGGGGFGYDPLFVPNGYAQSFAELGDDIKNRMSHRARALQQLKRHFIK